MKSRQNLAKNQELSLLLEMLQLAPEGLSLPEIARSLRQSPRTILRRLRQLMESDEVHREGRGPSTRYLAKNVHAKAKVKTSVGYNFDFLDRYIPNKTFFLQKSAKENLKELGKRPGNTSQIETFAKQIYERLLIDLSWSSSKLEGNTYSLLETERLLKDQEQAQGKDRVETQMILNHKEAVNFMIRNRAQISLNSLTIRNVHALLSDSLLANTADEGKIRHIPIGIDGSAYIPINNPQILQEQFDLFVKKVNAIKDPFEQSFFIMVFVPYLQPFIDLNKRTSRVVCNIPFIRNNFSPLSFNETDRTQYIQAIISVYEQNDTQALSELFINAYRSSAARYQVAKMSLVAPHPLKTKYRQFIRTGMTQLILTLKNKASALNYAEVAKSDRSHLSELIDAEIQNLHEGNFAKFDVQPSDFERWRKKFKKKNG